jgi:hypothetical protein
MAIKQIKKTQTLMTKYHFNITNKNSSFYGVHIAIMDIKEIAYARKEMDPMIINSLYKFSIYP